MKEKEFNLSDKKYANIYHEEDVREAVRILKDKIGKLWWIHKIIDKIFGEKLI